MTKLKDGRIVKVVLDTRDYGPYTGVMIQLEDGTLIIVLPTELVEE